jgi:hypothetical protein
MTKGFGLKSAPDEILFELFDGTIKKNRRMENF